MPKEILLYSSFYSFTAEDFITKMEEAKDDDIVLRLNTPGGDVQAGYGMIAKFAEHKGNKIIKVDGKANSMGAFFLAFAKDVEVLDVSEIVLHRAAYPDYYESRETFKGSDEYNFVLKMNKDIRKKLEAKIDVEAFEKVTGVTMDELFSMDSRIDVSLTPEQAKKVGLISKINKLDMNMKAEIQANAVSIAASFGVDVKELQLIKNEPIIEATNDKQIKNNKMTIEDLKANHPDVYNKVFALCSESAIAERNDTVEAWLTFVDVDAKAVSEGIKSGKKLSQTATAEFSRKLLSAEMLSNEEEGSQGNLSAEEAAKIEAEAQSKKDGLAPEIEAELDKLLNLKKD